MGLPFHIKVARRSTLSSVLVRQLLGVVLSALIITLGWVALRLDGQSAPGT
jgi:hypothetical protein